MKKKYVAILAGLGLGMVLTSCKDKNPGAVGTEDVWQKDILVKETEVKEQKVDKVTKLINKFVVDGEGLTSVVASNDNTVLKVTNEQGYIGYYSLFSQAYIVAPQYQQAFIQENDVYSSSAGSLLSIRYDDVTTLYDLYGNVVYTGEDKVTSVFGYVINKVAYVQVTTVDEDNITAKKYYSYKDAKYTEVEKLPLTELDENEADLEDYKPIGFGEVYKEDVVVKLDDQGLTGSYLVESGNIVTVFNSSDKAVVSLNIEDGTYALVGGNLIYQNLFETPEHSDDYTISIDGYSYIVKSYSVDLTTGEKKEIELYYVMDDAISYKGADTLANHAIINGYAIESDRVAKNPITYVIDKDGKAVQDLTEIAPERLTKLGSNFYDASRRIIYSNDFTVLAYIGDINNLTKITKDEIFIGYKVVNGTSYWGAVGFDGKIKIPFEYTSLYPLDGYSTSSISTKGSCLIGSKIDADGETQYYRINFSTGKVEHLGEDVDKLYNDLYVVYKTIDKKAAIEFTAQDKVIETITAQHDSCTNLYIDSESQKYIYRDGSKYYMIKVVEEYEDRFERERQDVYYLTFAVEETKEKFVTTGTEVTTQEALNKGINEVTEVKLGEQQIHISNQGAFKFIVPEDGYYAIQLDDKMQGMYVMTVDEKGDINNPTLNTYVPEDGRFEFQGYVKLEKGMTAYFQVERNNTDGAYTTLAIEKVGELEGTYAETHGLMKNNPYQLILDQKITPTTTKEGYYYVKLPYLGYGEKIVLDTNGEVEVVQRASDCVEKTRDGKDYYLVDTEDAILEIKKPADAELTIEAKLLEGTGKNVREPMAFSADGLTIDMKDYYVYSYCAYAYYANTTDKPQWVTVSGKATDGTTPNIEIEPYNSYGNEGTYRRYYGYNDVVCVAPGATIVYQLNCSEGKSVTYSIKTTAIEPTTSYLATACEDTYMVNAITVEEDGYYKIEPNLTNNTAGDTNTITSYIASIMEKTGTSITSPASYCYKLYAGETYYVITRVDFGTVGVAADITSTPKVTNLASGLNRTMAYTSTAEAPVDTNERIEFIPVSIETPGDYSIKLALKNTKLEAQTSATYFDYSIIGTSYSGNVYSTDEEKLVYIGSITEPGEYVMMVRTYVAEANAADYALERTISLVSSEITEVTGNSFTSTATTEATNMIYAFTAAASGHYTVTEASTFVESKLKKSVTVGVLVDNGENAWTQANLNYTDEFDLVKGQKIYVKVVTAASIAESYVNEIKLEAKTTQLTETVEDVAAATKVFAYENTSTEQKIVKFTNNQNYSMTCDVYSKNGKERSGNQFVVVKPGETVMYTVNTTDVDFSYDFTVYGALELGKDTASKGTFAPTVSRQYEFVIIADEKPTKDATYRLAQKAFDDIYTSNSGTISTSKWTQFKDTDGTTKYYYTFTSTLDKNTEYLFEALTTEDDVNFTVYIK